MLESSVKVEMTDALKELKFGGVGKERHQPLSN